MVHGANNSSLLCIAQGCVVTWNQPSSASSDPRVAKTFLRGRGQPHASGTVFIIKSLSGRCIEKYSVHPEEHEVCLRLAPSIPWSRNPFQTQAAEVAAEGLDGQHTGKLQSPPLTGTDCQRVV